MSTFTWLVFMKNWYDDYYIIAPYNCQFITVYQITPFIYKLSEIYYLRKPPHGLRMYVNYGTWDINTGLNVSKEVMYFRRLDMNQSWLIDVIPHGDCFVRNTL